jgi:hypothetical protein
MLRPVKVSRSESELPRIVRCGDRVVTATEIHFIQEMILQHPDWGRSALALHLCRAWDWRRPEGALNDQACRIFLVRLHERGILTLPPRKSASGYRKPEPPPALWPAAKIDPQGLCLDALVVRPIRVEERRRWQQGMAQFHYLGFRNTVGEAVRYVATLGSQWVALLAWAAAALKSRHRDAWIGWNASLKWRRLHLVANNVRFLILPGVQVKNLASKVLALNLRRLSEDWQKRYGHPILLAETFIDGSRFSGTCYRAAGWIALGETRGFGKRRQGYIEHGQPKMIFVRPLRPDAARMLSAPFSPPVSNLSQEKIPMLDVNALPIEGEGGLLDLLKTVRDPRQRRGIRHPLVSIVAIATCACLSGARSYDAIAQWAKELSDQALKRLGCKRRQPPSEKCLRLTLQRLDAVAFDQQIGGWLAKQNLLTGKGIAVDGKTIRGAHDGDQKAPHLLSAVVHEEGIVLAQQSVDEKTNEIPCIKPLLDPVNIAGAVVTGDSLHTQTETARYLVEDKKADYVFTVKDNQPTLKQDIQDLGLEAFPPSAHGND